VPRFELVLPSVLDRLESLYGDQSPSGPADPYHFLIWRHCGYPPSDAACGKGWDQLNAKIGVEPAQLVAATPRKLAAVLKAGGLIPDLRAKRLKEIAGRVLEEFGGDLRGTLARKLPQARKILKTFPGIADPGVDRILLFAGLALVPAVPSNCPYVLVRILHGLPGGAYRETYRQARQAIETELVGNLDTRTRAYLLLKRHGQELCKRANPKCDRCPVNSSCRFYAATSPP
jgi:endonuclease III